jgi:branched-chain amino acid transport system substrate-binding protein
VHRPARRLRLLALLCALTLVATACGSAHSRDELIKATSGSGRSSDAAESGGGSDGGGATATTVASDSGEVAGATGTTTGGTDGSVALGTSGGAASGGSTGGGSTGGGTGAPQCTGKEPTLNIGTVGEQSGVFGPFMVPITQGLQLWVKAVNARGGVNCHKIQLFVKDDGGDPSVHQSQVQELVEQRNVLALVATTAVLPGNSSVRYLESKGVPVIGNEGGSEWTYESPVYFPQIITGNTALATLVAAIAKVGKAQGKTKFGTVTCLEAALCSSLYGEAPQLSQKAGVSLVYRAQGSLTQPDFTSNCQAAKDAGVQMFLAGLDTNSIQRLLRNCQSIGFNPIYITGGPLVTPALLADPRAEGFLVGSGPDLYTDASNPAVAEFLTALRAYAPGQSPSVGAMTGWTAGKLFEAGLSGAAQSTRAGLLASMYKIKGDTLGGLTYPLTFTAGKPPPRVACLWIGQNKGGKLQPATGDGGRFCA